VGDFYYIIMAENKKSFVLYSDLIKSIEHLTNEEKGILFNHLLEYVNDKNPILTDRLILTAWKPIELQLKRDLIKFEQVKIKRSDAGKRSAELRANKSIQQNSTNSTLVEFVQHRSTNPTVNDNVNVNVILKEKEINSEFYNELLISESWIEVNAKNNRITPEKVKKYLNTFFDKLIAEGDRKSNKKEFMSHFARWLPIELKKEIKENMPVSPNKRNEF